MPALSDVLAGLEPIVPGLVVAGIFMVMLLVLRSVAKTKALRKKLLAWSGKNAEGARVYQCNFQVFPVTR